MKKNKYIFSALLILWGLIIFWTKLFIGDLSFPFLTILTLVGVIAGIFKNTKSNTILFFAGCVWIIFSAETMGFVIFFSDSDFERSILSLFPLLLASFLILSTDIEFKWANSPIKKILLIPVFLTVGIGSYIYKPTIKELNCWYYFNENNSYNVLFTQITERTFEIELSSEELKKKVVNEGIQYEGRSGYYCPNTKIRVITSFSKIVSAEILSFRNSELNKEVEFSTPTKIPLKNVDGILEILEPHLLSVWN